ncbi:hypothetical protein B7R87_28230 [Streptomyces tsukubensis]|nr:hypothetical protein B7R87_28230 [Streptomyces tsukubensis]
MRAARTAPDPRRAPVGHSGAAMTPGGPGAASAARGVAGGGAVGGGWPAADEAADGCARTARRSTTPRCAARSKPVDTGRPVPGCGFGGTTRSDGWSRTVPSHAVPVGRVPQRRVRPACVMGHRAAQALRPPCPRSSPGRVR